MRLVTGCRANKSLPAAERLQFLQPMLGGTLTNQVAKFFKDSTRRSSQYAYLLEITWLCSYHKSAEDHLRVVVFVSYWTDELVAVFVPVVWVDHRCAGRRVSDSMSSTMADMAAVVICSSIC